MNDIAHYDRVSEIVSCFSGIDRIPPQVLKDAAHRGEMVHRMIEGFFKGIGAPDSCDPFRPYYDSFKALYDKKPFIPAWMEQRFFSRSMMITGKPDIMTDDGRLIDYKTGASIQKSWPVQLAGYRKLLNENDVYPKSYHILWMNGKSSAKFIEYNIDEYDTIFDSCLKLYRYFNKKKQDFTNSH